MDGGCGKGGGGVVRGEQRGVWQKGDAFLYLHVG